MPKIKINNPKNIIQGTPSKYYFRLKNTSGPKGDKGDTGDTGSQGPKGDPGNAATVYVGTTTTLPVGQNASVTNVGSQYSAILDFGIPQGPQGPKGDTGSKGDTGERGETGPQGPRGEKGTNATVYVGTTTTGAPGTNANVYNSGTDNSAVLNFTIPQGAKGDTGPANTLSIGSVTKGENAGATITGDAPNQTLNLVLPKGDKGDKGSTGDKGDAATIAVGSTSASSLPVGSQATATVTNSGTSSAATFDFTFGLPTGATGATGQAATIAAGTTTTLTPGQSATVTNSGTSSAAVFDFGIPKGDTGSVKSSYVGSESDLPSTGEEDTFYITDKDLTTGTESGNPVVINNTQTAGRVTDFKIFGDTSQVTLTGKNLFGSSEVITQNCTYTESNGIYTVVATGNAPSLRFALVKSIAQGTLTVSGSKLAGTGITVSLRGQSAQFIDANMNVSQLPRTVTPTADAYYLTMFMAISTGETLTIDTTDLMIESGSTATAYEQYCGGTPAPNPSYPQNINVVTGEQTIVQEGKNLCPNPVEYGIYDLNGAKSGSDTGSVRSTTQLRVAPSTQYIFSCNGAKINTWLYEYDENGAYISGTRRLISQTAFTTGSTTHFVTFFKGSDTGLTGYQLELGSTATSYEPYWSQTYPINLGKNLIPYPSTSGSTTISDVQFTQASDGKVTASGTTSGAVNWLYTNTFYPTKTGTYTLSFTGTLENVTFYCYDLTDSVMIMNVTSTQTQKSGTLTAGHRYQIYFNQGSSGKQISIDGYAQLELGSSASPYAPYITPIELAKIGTYQDRIYKSSGKWYVEKNVGKVVLDGTENWSESGSTHERFLIGSAHPTFSLLAKGAPSYNSKCDYFTFQESGTAWTGIGKCGFDATGTYWCMISGISSLADFKTWIGTNNVRVYYPLATATTTEITDSTLISQLEAIKSAELNAGLNTFTNSATAPNLAGEFEISYELWEKYNKHDVFIWNDAINDYQKIVGLEGQS